MTPRRAPAQAGFTLLEVLVAMVILGLAVVSLIQLSSQGLRLVKVSEDHQLAALLAERIARGADPTAEGIETGRDGIYAWERRVVRVALPEELKPPTGQPPALYAMTVAVRWDRARSVQIATLRLGPAPPEGQAPGGPPE